MSRYDHSGFSGQSYDRNVFEANLSTVNKLQRDYWNAKQVLRKKLGKEEDKHVVASDSELDAKLDLFHSVQDTCVDLIKTLEKYQKCVCVLSREENAMGRFLKDQGALDRTPAGKMMDAVGKAQCYTSQQRLNLRHSLGRLRHDVETFRYRAIGDSVLSVDQMEDSRTHYRASLRWMQDISSKLDPEQYKKLEKFRKVQNEVRLNKEKFDRQKWAVCQKVDLLCASRSNLFSNTLVPYQNDALKFWEKTAHTMAAVLENIKDYQSYEFKLLKGLNPLQALDTLKDENDKKKDDKDDDVKSDDDQQLINLGDSDANETKPIEERLDSTDLLNNDKESLINCFDAGMNGNNDDVYHDIRLLDELNDNEPLLSLHGKDDRKTSDQDSNLLLAGFDEGENAQPSKEDLDLLNDILGNEENSGTKELEQQWESVFGDFAHAEPVSPSSQPTDVSQKPMMLNTDLLLNDPQMQKQHAPPASSGGGFLPSQLMDMMMTGGGGSVNQMNYPPQQSLTMQQQLPQGQHAMGQMPMSGGPMMGGYQPPSYRSMFGSNVPAGGTQQQVRNSQNQPMKTASKKDSSKDNKAAWFNLFAELDPLQNPDALGKKEADEKDKGGAC